MLITTPYVSIKPNYLTTYCHYDSTNTKVYTDNNPLLMPVDNKQHGIMSHKANKRVKLAIDWMIELAKDKPLEDKGSPTNFKFKLNFITLTLSSKQKHSDNEIKSKLFNQFLTEIRFKFKCDNYLWRAESQKNGNIHFHVVTDVYIPWRTIRTSWNRIQEKLGYVSAFTERTGKVDPNSTDVHSIKHVKNLSAYLAKYCTKHSKGYLVVATKATPEPYRPQTFLNYSHPKLAKNPKFYRQIHGKLWGLSQQLSSLKSATHEVCGRIEEEINYLYKKDKTKVKELDRATIYMYTVKELIKVKCYALAAHFKKYVASVLTPVHTCEQLIVPIIHRVERVIKPVQLEMNL